MSKLPVSEYIKRIQVSGFFIRATILEQGKHATALLVDDIYSRIVYFSKTIMLTFAFI